MFENLVYRQAEELHRAMKREDQISFTTTSDPRGRRRRSMCLQEQEVHGNHALLAIKFTIESLLFMNLNLFMWSLTWNCPVLMEVILDCGKADVRIVLSTGVLLVIDGFHLLLPILKDLQPDG